MPMRRLVLLLTTFAATLSHIAAAFALASEAPRLVALDEAIGIAWEQNHAIETARLDYLEAEVGLRQTEANNLVQPSPVALIQARHHLEIAARAIELARLDVELEVKERYYSVLRTQDLMAIAAEALDVSERQLDVALRRFENGTGTRADVLSAEHQVAQARADLEQAKEGYDLAVMAFRHSLGLALNEPVVPDPDVELTLDASVDLEADLERALASRIEILQVQSGIEAARKQVEVVRNDYTPALSLEASEIGLAKALNQLEIARSGIELEIRQLYAALKDAERRVPVLERGVAKAEEELHIAQQLFDVNMAPLVQVLGAQVALAKARSDYTHGIYDLSLARARYDRAVVRSLHAGGGS